ncbi:UNKNOWN [Stylonychia lemnae]|uniref:LITAF domain-containing protein n=1 Tax=Stylonychia lemnae TaxID=5949 RepID=A0A078ANA6_STYLE|nr:UNKNOWN [Stylonychia lemnae]|eukprot:CDW83654.1 UNKNOWN [Stylonychia lemnae]
MSEDGLRAKKKKDDDLEMVEDNEDKRLIEEQQKVQNPSNQPKVEEDFDIRHCNVDVVTYVELETNSSLLLISLLSILAFGLLSTFIIPVVYLVSQIATHRCSRCLQKMGQKSWVGLPNNFSDEIWQFRLGKCSIILARLYAIIALSLVLGFCLYYVYLRPSFFQPLTPYHTPEQSIQISSSWNEFLIDCGGQVIVENFIHARSVFNQKYENNVIEWLGYFSEIKDTDRFPLFSDTIVKTIMIKMFPSESMMYPDIVLSIPYSLDKQLSEMFSTLKKGHELRFKAKLVSIGNEFKMHHLLAQSIQKTGYLRELSELFVRDGSMPLI